ncbi:hypothetical protein [Euzebya rosea]|uniref:hypothetical protein n=1 Tax=Euzebya rosea TaxID=2052804 RepID=UPI000D3E0B2E|nr:hypothetical protein [Euzebya rosea]
MAKQCPKCPLKFDLAPMLADHLRTDHGFEPETLVHLQPESIRIGMVDARRDARARAEGQADPQEPQ